MGPLKNPRHEKFCLALLKGKTLTDAAKEAGYSPVAASVRGTNLVKQFPEIFERYRELQLMAVDDAVMSVIERKERLTEIARARLTDFVTVQEDGSTIYKMPFDNKHSGAIEELVGRKECRRKGAPIVITKIKLHDPIRAIDMLNKLGGDYPAARVELTGKDNGPIEVEHSAKDKLLEILSKLAERSNE